MKKILLGLGSAALATLPLVAVVSCTAETPTKDLKISLMSDRTTVTKTTIDSSITAIEAAQLLPETTEAELKVKSEALVKALSPVFLGVSIDNTFDFVISLNKDTNSPSITLTGKQVGNSQNIFATSKNEDKKILTSIISLPPTQSMAISVKTSGITQEIINKAVIDFELTQTLDEMVIVLNTVFTGVTKANLTTTAGVTPLFVEITKERKADPNVTGDKGEVASITLIAAPDYFFTNANTTVLKSAVSVSAPATK